MRRLTLWAVFIACCCASACSSGVAPMVIKDKVPLSKVTGIVTVNGEPASGLMVRCHPKGSIAEKRPQFTSRFVAETDKNGKFAMHTYAGDDGLPVGEYGMTFKWLPDPEVRMREGENDRLDGEFADPKKPFKTIKVEDKVPLDVGTIDLVVPGLKK